MEINKKAHIFLVSAFLIGIFGNTLYAQTTKMMKASENYFIKESDEKKIFYQRLSWEERTDILSYEFILYRKNAKGIWEQLKKERSEKNYTDLSLPPGTYRYKVGVVNFLNQIEGWSDYRIFYIRIAHQPEAYKSNPDIIYLDDLNEADKIELTISGKHFYDYTNFSLQTKSGRIIPARLVEVKPNGRSAKIEIETFNLTMDDYFVTVRDASGLTDQTKKITVQFQKPVDIYLSAGYAPTAFTGSAVFKNKNYFNTVITPAGFNLRLSVLPIKRMYGSFGFNLTGSYGLLKNRAQHYTVSGHMLIAQLNAVYVRKIIKKLVNIDAHLGAGLMSLIDVNVAYDKVNNDKKSYMGVTVNAGVAVQVYMYKRLYCEFNFDNIFAIRKDFPIYSVQPSLSIGWEF